MRIAPRAVVALLIIVLVAPGLGASAAALAGQEVSQRSVVLVPPQPAPAVPVGPVPGVSAALAARAFTAKTGIIFQSVRPDRVLDYETVIGYLKAALAKTTTQAVRAQAEGWRVFKAAEPGPNGTVTYVFVFDPAVPGADYGLGRVLAEAYPGQIQEIWKLYTGALIGGGSLLNLTPVEGLPPGRSAAAPVAPATASSKILSR